MSRGMQTGHHSRRAEDAPAHRARPKDRRNQIARAAAEAFSRDGYHSVTVEEIASAVGISGAALYRHFPNKYALFREVTSNLAGALEVASTAADGTSPPTESSEIFDAQLGAIIGTTIDLRRSAGLYRWEGRYLEPRDRHEIRARVWLVNRRVGATLRDLRPELPEFDNVLLTMAMFSAVGSITAHSVPIARGRLEELLLAACRRLSTVTWIPEPCAAAGPRGHTGIPSVNKREQLLSEAIRLFDAHGYHDVSIEQIAASTGLNASGLYRHFTSKADLLAAAFHRAADRLAVGVSSALAASATPRDALDALVDVYVQLSFAQRELLSVYFSEGANLSPGRRAELRAIQRLNVDEWAHMVRSCRAGLSVVESRILVHAALNLVVDVGRFLHFESTGDAQMRIRRMMLAVMVDG
ncbi:TetR/AcrR family transcriptional regulator [Rhodococcus triatomae]|uniref:TetR/AcrR family transcriptional regulator n=1 Tax=Rhodococcus triatomae TaxID=300028 RepID=UPI001FEA3F7E|nr:TetR/AcrR family transcriptional regulator [Rhodococcus triatomae]